MTVTSVPLLWHSLYARTRREGEWGVGKAIMESARRHGAALTITELRKKIPAELPKWVHMYCFVHTVLYVYNRVLFCAYCTVLV